MERSPCRLGPAQGASRALRRAQTRSRQPPASPSSALASPSPARWLRARFEDITFSNSVLILFKEDKNPVPKVLIM